MGQGGLESALWLKSRARAGLGLVAVALNVARVTGMPFGKGPLPLEAA